MAGISAQAPAQAPSRLALRPRVLGTLLWLRWKLLLRRWARSPATIIGSVFLLVFLVVPVGFLAAGTAYAYQNLTPTSEALDLLFYILFAAYILWTVLPLLSFSINEGLDITKLSNYPLSQPELMVGLVLATLLDIPTLALAAMLAAVVIGWAHTSVQAVLIAVTVIVAYLHIVGLSQLALAALGGLLRSRRWRDLSIVLGSVLLIAYYLVSQVLLRPILSRLGGNGIASLLSLNVGSWMQFLPPGMAVRAVAAIAANDAVGAAAWLAALIGSCALVFWAWSAVLARALATPDEAGVVSRRRSARRVSDAAPKGVAALLPPATFALAAKDLRYYAREPYYKRLYLGSVYFVIVFIVLPLIERGSSGSLGHSSGTAQIALLSAVFLVSNLSVNAFGYESRSISTLALFPVPARDVFLGKNVATFVLGLIEGAILLAIVCFVTQAWAFAPVYAAGMLGAMGVAMGLGNIIAVFLPIRVARMTIGQSQNNPGSGFTNGLIRVGATLGGYVLMAPIVIGVIITTDISPSLSGQIAMIIIALIYGAALYAGGTAIAASAYYPRLTKIIEVLSVE
jgi:ABC-2 type transport system permease protein